MWHTFLQELQAFEGDLKLVGVAEFGRIIEDVDAQERYDRHSDQQRWDDILECKIEMWNIKSLLKDDGSVRGRSEPLYCGK